MRSSNSSFENIGKPCPGSKIKSILSTLLKRSNEVIKSLSKNYKLNYDVKEIKKYRKSTNFRIIGMGGSSLGAQTIYDYIQQEKLENKNTRVVLMSATPVVNQPYEWA